MVSILKAMRTGRVLRSTTRASTRSRAYTLCHNNAKFNNSNDLFGPWRACEHNGLTLKLAASSGLTESHRFGPTRTGLLRCFSASSAVRIGKARYEEIRKDPDAWKAHAAKAAAYARRHSDENPESRRRNIEKNRISYARLLSTQPNYLLKQKLYDWIYRYNWVRDTLPWKSYQPILYAEPVEHQCHGCQLAQRNGRRTWWRSKSTVSGETHADVSKEAHFLCHSCYTQQRTWNAVMPEGYEDVDNLKKLIARKKQLDGAISGNDLAKDSYLVRRLRIYSWCSQRGWIRELPWPTHQPLVFEQKQELGCTNCLFAKRRPLYLWWQSPQGTHICTACYTRPEWSEIMPKGYEDARSLKDLIARKKQLDGLVSGHAITPSYTQSFKHLHIKSKTCQSTTKRPMSNLQTSLHSAPSRKFSSISAASTPSEKKPKQLLSNSELREYNREAKRRQIARLRLDEKTYRAFLDRGSGYSMKSHDRNPEIRKRRRDQAEIIDEKLANIPGFNFRKWIRLVLTRYPWIRDLPWKLCVPVITSESIEHRCAGCNLKRRRGMRLWWRKVNPADSGPQMEPETFFCHPCHFPLDDQARVMPVGYEDVTSYQEFLDRKIQLDGYHESGPSLLEEAIRKKEMLRSWCRSEWVRELPWKVHRPVVLEQKVYDRCARCVWARHRYMKFWWRSSDETLCNNCYAKGDWDDILPRGYEGVRTSQDLRSRKAQLDKQEYKSRTQQGEKEIISPTN